MNWKRFRSDCLQIAEFLVQQGYAHPDLILIRMAALAISHPDLEPQDLLALAAPPAADGYPPALPSELGAIVSRWSGILPSDPAILGEMYERIALGRRTQGRYYTPQEVIHFIMVHTVQLADVVENPRVRVLDPSCGCGFFLLAAYDCLFRKYREARKLLEERYPQGDWSDEGIHRWILRENLWGADIDASAAQITSLCLQMKAPSGWNGAIAPHIVVCDSLRHAGETDKLFWLARYDYVIGNPPYLSFGLRGLGRLDEDYQNFLRQEYSASAQYKLSYYVLFMQKGIDMLAEGGKLGYIVPDSFLLGRYYSKIRRYILEKTRIEQIVAIAAPVFQSATIGKSTICVFTRTAEEASRNQQEIAVYFVKDKAELADAHPICRYSQDYFLGLPQNRFRIYFDIEAKHLVDKLDQISRPLEEFASGHTGIRALTRQSDIIAEGQVGASWHQGLISGRQITRYHISYEGHWLHIDPAVLYRGGWNREIVQQKKILMRQTGYSVIACMDEGGLYHLNNIHSFVAKGKQLTPEYLLLLLNSQLMSFYYHVVSLEYGRPMAQIDIDTIELLPVRTNEAINRQAPELVKLMTDTSTKAAAGEPGAEARIAALDDYFDQLVFRIYELTEDEIAYIQAYEGRLKKQDRLLTRRN